MSLKEIITVISWLFIVYGQVVDYLPTQIEVKADVSTGFVTRVVDGDTFVAIVDSEEVKVRLVGIDTPEIKTKDASDCYALEAKLKLKELIEKQQVRLTSDSFQPDKDRYGRLLRYAFLEDLDINKELISLGYARAYTKIKSDQLVTYLDLEQEAREGSKGLWEACPVENLPELVE